MVFAVATSSIKRPDGLSLGGKVLFWIEAGMCLFLIVRAVVLFVDELTVSSVFVRLCLELGPVVFLISLMHSLVKGDEKDSFPELEEEAIYNAEIKRGEQKEGAKGNAKRGRSNVT